MVKDQNGIAHIAAAVVIGFVLVGGGVTTVAADSSKPGDALYSVDRGVEKVRLAATLGESDKAQKRHDMAKERLQELEQLQAEGADPERIQEAADEYGASISEAAQSLADAAKDGDKHDELANVVEKATSVHLDTLATVHEKVPEEAKDSIERAMSESEQGAEKSLQALNGSMPEEVRNRAEDRIEESRRNRGGPESLPPEAEENMPADAGSGRDRDQRAR